MGGGGVNAVDLLYSSIIGMSFVHGKKKIANSGLGSSCACACRLRRRKRREKKKKAGDFILEAPSTSHKLSER